MRRPRYWRPPKDDSEKLRFDYDKKTELVPIYYDGPWWAHFLATLFSKIYGRAIDLMMITEEKFLVELKDE